MRLKKSQKTYFTLERTGLENFSGKVDFIKFTFLFFLSRPFRTKRIKIKIFNTFTKNTSHITHTQQQYE